MGRYRFPGPRPPPSRSVMDRIHDAPDTPAITRSSSRKETAAPGFFITAVALGHVRVFPIRNGLYGIDVLIAESCRVRFAGGALL
jgi:hypothetical protein